MLTLPSVVSLRSCGSIRLSFATAMLRPSPTLRHETSSYGCKLRCLCRALVLSRNSAARIKIAGYIECEGLEGALSILTPILQLLRMSAEDYLPRNKAASSSHLTIEKVKQSRSPQSRPWSHRRNALDRNPSPTVCGYFRQRRQHTVRRLVTLC